MSVKTSFLIIPGNFYVMTVIFLHKTCLVFSENMLRRIIKTVKLGIQESVEYQCLKTHLSHALVKSSLIYKEG